MKKSGDHRRTKILKAHDATALLPCRQKTSTRKNVSSALRADQAEHAVQATMRQTQELQEASLAAGFVARTETVIKPSPRRSTAQEIQKLEEDIVKLVAGLSERRSRLSEAVQEKEAALKQIEKLAKDLSDLESKATMAETSAEAAINENERSLAEHVQTIRELNDNIQKLKGDLSAKQREHKQEISGLTEDWTGLQHELEARIHELENKVVEKEDELRSIQSTLLEAQGLLADLRSDHAKLQSEKSLAQQERKHAVEELRQTQATLHETSVKLDIRDVRQREQEDRISKLENSFRISAAEHEHLLKERESSFKENETIFFEKCALYQRDLNQRAERISALEKQLTEATAELEQECKRISALENQLTEATAEWEQEYKRTSALENQLTEATAEREQECKVLKERLSEQLSRIGQLEREAKTNPELKECINVKDGSVERPTSLVSLKDKIGALKSEIGDWYSTTEGLQEKLTLTQSKINASQADISARQADMPAQRPQLNSLQTQLNDVQIRLNTLQSRINASKTEQSRLQRSLEQEQEANQKLKEQIDYQHTFLSDLRDLSAKYGLVKPDDTITGRTKAEREASLRILEPRIATLTGLSAATKTKDSEIKALKAQITILEQLNATNHSRLSPMVGQKVSEQEVKPSSDSLVEAVVVCVDGSGSMAGTPWQMAKTILQDLVARVKRENPQALISILLHGINSSFTTTSSRVSVLQGLTRVSDNAGNLLEHVSPSGSYEAVEDALLQAISILREGQSGDSRLAAMRVFMIGDGSVGFGRPSSLIKSRADQLKAMRVPVHVIAMTSDRCLASVDDELKEISATTGGKVVTFPTCTPYSGASKFQLASEMDYTNLWHPRASIAESGDGLSRSPSSPSSSLGPSISSTASQSTKIGGTATADAAAALQRQTWSSSPGLSIQPPHAQIPEAVVICIDASSSMSTQGRWPLAKVIYHWILRQIEQKSPQTQVGLLLHRRSNPGGKERAVVGRVLKPVFAQAYDLLDGVELHGSSRATHQAVEEASTMIRDLAIPHTSPDSVRLILIGDGEFESASTPMENLRLTVAVSKVQNMGASVHAIAINPRNIRERVGPPIRNVLHPSKGSTIFEIVRNDHTSYDPTADLTHVEILGPNIMPPAKSARVSKDDKQHDSSRPAAGSEASKPPSRPPPPVPIKRASVFGTAFRKELRNT